MSETWDDWVARLRAEWESYTPAEKELQLALTHEILDEIVKEDQAAEARDPSDDPAIH